MDVEKSRIMWRGRQERRNTARSFLLLALMGLAALAPCQEQAPPRERIAPRLQAYDRFFLRVQGIVPGPRPVEVGRLSRAEAAREFGLTASELALVKPIAADWLAKYRPLQDQVRKLSASGMSSRWESQDLTERFQKLTFDHIDQLRAAFGAARFAAIDAVIIERHKSGADAGPRPEVTVLESNGKRTVIRNVGMTYSGGRPGEPLHHTTALVVKTSERSLESFRWDSISRIEAADGRLTITWFRRQVITGASFPSAGSLDGETRDGRRVDIPFANIKRITVAQRPESGQPPTWGPMGGPGW